MHFPSSAARSTTEPAPVVHSISRAHRICVYSRHLATQAPGELIFLQHRRFTSRCQSVLRTCQATAPGALWLKKEHPGSAGASPSRGRFSLHKSAGGKGRTFRGAKRDDGTRPTGRGGSLPFPDGAGKLLSAQADCFTNKTYHDCTSHERLRHQVTARSAQRFPG